MQGISLRRFFLGSKTKLESLVGFPPMPPLSLGQGVSHEWRIPRLQQRVECETQGPFCGVTFMYSVDGKVNFPIHM